MKFVAVVAGGFFLVVVVGAAEKKTSLFTNVVGVIDAGVFLQFQSNFHELNNFTLVWFVLLM